MNIKDLLKVGPENKSDTRFKLLVLFGLGSWVYKHGIVKFVIACIILVAIAALVEAGGNIKLQSGQDVIVRAQKFRPNS